MASQRRLVAEILSIGRIKASKKHPDRLHLEISFPKKGKGLDWKGDSKGLNKLADFVPIRDLPLAALQMVIVDWLTPEYQAKTEGKPSPWNAYLPMDEESLRLALDLCYKELARRSERCDK